LFSLSEQFKMQVCVFPKTKTDKNKRKQNTPAKKDLKAKKSKKQKEICIECAFENFMQQIPWETKRKKKKILFDGKEVSLVVPWVRVDLDLFISLLSI
jgi:hypothetical protein